MYPILFEPIYKTMVWGGERLKTCYSRQIPNDKTGESWDISCREKEMGVVENGFLCGQKFLDVINSDRLAYLGNRLKNIDQFPLLVKIIDAKDNLSIQVHPGDDYARKNENEYFGKTEMWYILDAAPNSALYIGLDNGVTKEQLSETLSNGNGNGGAEECFGKLPVKKGDIINIPSGLIHAITSGIMLAEIQQNSDITYRVYDYGRLGLDGNPRDLHIQKALDVIDFEGKLKKCVTPGISVKKDNAVVTYLIANQYFAIEKIAIDKLFRDTTDGEKFLIFTCTEGEAVIASKNKTTVLQESRSAFIPAGMGEFEITGNAVLLKSYVPNIEVDFITPLKQAGFTDAEITENCSIEKY